MPYPPKRPDRLPYPSRKCFGRRRVFIRLGVAAVVVMLIFVGLRLVFPGFSLPGLSLARLLTGGQEELRLVSPESRSVSIPDVLPTLEYRQRVLPHGVVHGVVIPVGFWRGRSPVVPAVGDVPLLLGDFAQRYRAMAVLNGGFFDPDTGQTASYVAIGGRWVADPRQNLSLMTNPALAPYRDQILNRSELRRYQCEADSGVGVAGKAGQANPWYGIALHEDPVPPACQLVDALGGGPRLLPNITAEAEGFLAVVAGEVVRDPLGVDRRNARTAVGITSQGDLVWVMAAQRPEDVAEGIPSGLTLAELADVLADWGAVEALNLDGGGSSALVYGGITYPGQYDEGGQPVQRAVKSVLLIPGG